MVTDKQVKRLFQLMQRENTLSMAATKAGLDEKTARKYLKAKKLPSELQRPRTWRTHDDIFAEVWDEVRGKLELNPGLQAKTLFQDLQRRYIGRFADGQLRTFQRRLKHWRATEGPPKEVFFEQLYRPGERSQSDFTSMNRLGVTIQGEPFDHLIYHFVLPYSNWEAGTLCFSESFEALSEGLQNALWELGSVPLMHQTDRLSTAVNKDTHPEVFTRRYMALLAHYSIEPLRTQAGCPHENGDVEQRHHRFKRAVEQSLMLRASHDFDSREHYQVFLRRLFDGLNAGRQARLTEELKWLRALPARRLESCRAPIEVRVSQGSTIRVLGNTYSVDSRLTGERVKVKLFVEHLEVWYGQRCLHRIERLRGKGRYRINYRHIIDWLVRKPGAFANYRYREDLFPSHRFRMAYDLLRRSRPHRADKDYLRLLHMAARQNEAAVDDVLRYLIDDGQPITPEAVKELVGSVAELPSVRDVTIDSVDLSCYDALLSGDGVSLLGSSKTPMTDTASVEVPLP